LESETLASPGLSGGIEIERARKGLSTLSGEKLTTAHGIGQQDFAGSADDSAASSRLFPHETTSKSDSEKVSSTQSSSSQVQAGKMTFNLPNFENDGTAESSTAGKLEKVLSPTQPDPEKDD
jgi:hypothetical protein